MQNSYASSASRATPTPQHIIHKPILTAAAGPWQPCAELVTPLRFGRVTSGRDGCVFRGSYPTLRHFRHLKSLKLKTILSVTPEPPSADIVRFADMFDIKIIHIQAIRTDRTHSLQRQLVKATNALIDPANLPAYVHCLDGRRITGLVVLVLRRLQSWSLEAATAEYWRYQAPILPPVAEVARMDRDLSKVFFDTSEDFKIPIEIPSWLWEGKRCGSVPPGLRIKYKKSSKDSSQDNLAASDNGGSGAMPPPSFGNSIPGTIFEDNIFKPMTEQKGRYSFSGHMSSMRDQGSTSATGGPYSRSVAGSLGDSNHGGKIGTGKNGGGISGNGGGAGGGMFSTPSKDQTVSALDLAMPEQSSASKSAFLNRLNGGASGHRYHQEI